LRGVVIYSPLEGAQGGVNIPLNPLQRGTFKGTALKLMTLYLNL